MIFKLIKFKKLCYLIILKILLICFLLQINFIKYRDLDYFKFNKQIIKLKKYNKLNEKGILNCKDFLIIVNLFNKLRN